MPLIERYLIDGEKVRIDRIDPQIIERREGTLYETIFKWWNLVWWSLPYGLTSWSEFSKIKDIVNDEAAIKFYKSFIDRMSNKKIPVYVLWSDFAALVYRLAFVSRDGRRTESVLKSIRKILTRMLIFAYGSNMDPTQMKERCPNSDLKTFIAEARGWKLCFPRTSKRRRGGVGSIERRQGFSVWGVVFSVNDKDLKTLDLCEGF